jgi:hypothetical protein
MLKLPDVCSWAINHCVSLSLTNRKFFVHLHALYSPRTALRTFTPRRDELMICGQYATPQALTAHDDCEYNLLVQ